MDCRGSGASVCMGDLDVIPRILFATDGSITHILEAYAGEPVDLVRLSSSIVEDTSAWRKLGVGDDERALERLYLVQGRQSRRVFVHAVSVVLLDRLPEPVAQDLMASGASLLKLLTAHRIGTFRETVSDWQGQDEHIAGCLGMDGSEALVGRTYHIVMGGRLVAWVTETFPRDGFSLPPHGAERANGADIDLTVRGA